MTACRAVIKVLFSFQQGFTSRVTVSHLEKVNVHNCLGPAGRAAGVSLDAIHGSHDHTSYPAGWGRCWTDIQCFPGIRGLVTSVEMGSLQPHPLWGSTLLAVSLPMTHPTPVPEMPALPLFLTGSTNGSFTTEVKSGKWGASGSPGVQGPSLVR